MERDRPTSGDVLIVPDSATGRGYTLSTAPDGLSQLWYASYEQAVRKALEWGVCIRSVSVAWEHRRTVRTSADAGVLTCIRAHLSSS